MKDKMMETALKKWYSNKNFSARQKLNACQAAIFRKFTPEELKIVHRASEIMRKRLTSEDLRILNRINDDYLTELIYQKYMLSNKVRHEKK